MNLLHDLFYEVRGRTFDEINRKARTIAEAYFGADVAWEINSTGEGYEFSTGEPRTFKALVVARRLDPRDFQ